MRTEKGIHAAYRAVFERIPSEFTARMVHESDGRIVSIELPGGAMVAFAADEMRTFLNDVEGRENAK